MPILIPVSLCFVNISYSIFICAYKKKEPHFLKLCLFVMNALVFLYAIFNYLGLLK